MAMHSPVVWHSNWYRLHVRTGNRRMKNCISRKNTLAIRPNHHFVGIISIPGLAVDGAAVGGLVIGSVATGWTVVTVVTEILSVILVG